MFTCVVSENNRLVLFRCISGCLLFLICIEFVYLYFPVRFCLSVSVKWLAVKTASEMTYTMSSGALNSTPSIQPRIFLLDYPATLPTAGWLLDRAAFCHCSCCISSHSPPRPVRKCSAKITGRPITVAIAVVFRPTTWYKHGGLVHCFLPLTHLKLCNIIA